MPEPQADSEAKAAAGSTTAMPPTVGKVGKKAKVGHLHPAPDDGTTTLDDDGQQAVGVVGVEGFDVLEEGLVAAGFGGLALE